jgi:signal transduction histidine kinase
MTDFTALPRPNFRDRLLSSGTLVALGLIAFFLLAAVTIHFDRRNVLNTAANRANALAEIAAAHVEQALTAIDANIRALDFDLEESAPDLGVVREKLRLMQLGSRALLGIGVIDASGQLLVGSAANLTGPVDLSSRPFFVTLRGGQTRDLTLSPPARTSTTGELGIPISRALWDADGKFAGVVSGRLNPAYFEQFFRVLGADAVAILLPDGTILARYPEIDLLAAPKLPVNGNTEGRPTFVISPVDGVERLLAFRRLTVTPALIEIAFDRDRLLEDWGRRRNLIVAASVLIAGLSVALLAGARRRARDFSEKLRAEATAAVEAEAREAAVEASRRKSEFLAHMSHEIRTPLNAIIGFSQMISGQMLGPVGQPRYRDYAADILYSAEHLLSVINNVLDLSKVEAGKWSLDVAHVPVGELVEAACRLAAARAAHEDVALDVRAVPAVSVLGDRRTLVQILLNLLINAIKFAGDDRSVTVACERMRDGSVEFSIVDRGPGMTREDIERALRPFETASSVQARRRQDTGLGLPLARVFAELHEGALTLESAPERGTTARLYLPAARVRAL